MRNRLKFGDFIIIGVVLVMAGALAAALTFHSSGDKLYAEVWQNDTLIERVQLTDATDRTIKLDGNTIVLSGKTAKMADADCRDQVCVRTGSLSKTDQYLLEHRCVTKRGKQFTRFAIRGILTNPVYMIADETAYQYLKENNVDLFAERAATWRCCPGFCAAANAATICARS